MIHDQFSDKSFRIFAKKAAALPQEARNMLKTAEVDPDEAEGLPDTSFAWPEMRKFAIHTPEHTLLSMVYAHDEAIPMPVKNRLEKAASLYGVNVCLTEKVAQEEVSDVNDYLIPHRKIGRITSREHVKEASRFFVDNYKKMDLSTRASAAATLVKKARQYSCKISPTFYKHAGLTLTNPKVAGEWLEVRASLAADETAKSGFSKLAAHVQDPSNFSRASRRDLIKLADTIAILDEKAGLVGKYDITLPDPLLTVFNTSKIAEDTVSLANKDVPVSALLALDPETYGDVLGADVVSEITDDKGQMKEDALLDILRTLPADLQALLVSTLGL